MTQRPLAGCPFISWDGNLAPQDVAMMSSDVYWWLMQRGGEGPWWHQTLDFAFAGPPTEPQNPETPKVPFLKSEKCHFGPPRKWPQKSTKMSQKNHFWGIKCPRMDILGHFNWLSKMAPKPPIPPRSPRRNPWLEKPMVSNVGFWGQTIQPWVPPPPGGPGWDWVRRSPTIEPSVPPRNGRLDGWIGKTDRIFRTLRFRGFGAL